MIRRIGLLILIWIPLQGAGFSGINSAESIPIGGIRQWITLKGVNDTYPVLLFLHGGPGSSSMSYGDRFTKELQKHFVVVQWDQRETGKTKSMNRSPLPLTVSLFEEDVVEVINYLRNRFGKEKIYLMGHSWGGFLGMEIASKHPELLECYLAVSPMIFQLASENLSLKMMIDSAKKTNNPTEIQELEKVKIPFENGEQLYYHRKWLAITMGQKPVPRAYVEDWAKVWLNLFNEASRVNFFDEAPEIHCPIYFFLGTKDYQTYFKVTEDYFNKVKADKKELFWFTNSAHLVNLTEPGKMQEIIIRRILEKSPK